MKLARIGVTAWTEIKPRGPYATVSRHYADSVVRAGGLPLLLPVLADLSLVPSLLDGLDGLLLTGGTDVNPGLYGQERHPAVAAVDPDRDRWERALVLGARDRGMPVLGICRGAQLINVALGGTLVQDLATQRPGTLDHVRDGQPMDSLAHPVRLVPGPSRLGRALGRESASSPVLTVNSFHHQAVDVLAPGLVATAWAPDGVVEAFEAPGDAFLVGVQFHPEALTADHPEFTALFRALVGSAQS